MTEDRLSLISVGIIFTIIGMATMLLRFLTYLVRCRPVGKDDYSMLTAWLCSLGFTAASFVSVRWGVGLRSDTLPSWQENAIQAVYVIEIFYYLSIFFIKLSVLFMYLRLVANTNNMLRKGTIHMAAIIIAQFVSTVVVVAVQCVPIAKYWDPSVPGTCINITAFFYSTNVFTIVTDGIILALPVSTLWKIQCPLVQRVGILSAFLFGGLSTIASCIRLYSVRIYTESSRPILDAAPINTWNFVCLCTR
ncbi:MAG: hypothetical protein FE78DRAFT_71750 [Acidomyces sp. 'richmondensis']|nr:MAG: hypothetical protein FE78DRAFT_71750 [Acidomyces sp. 'richmondensis']